MDEQSLYQLKQDTVLIVPTGSLATHLNETFAAQKILRNQHVWEAPTILSWSEWLRELWQYNRADFNHANAVIGVQQSKLLWTQIIEKSKYASSELTLLNVQQTVRACMRSDRILSDWCCNESNLSHDHVSDVDQFLAWRKDYHASLAQRGIIDEPSLQSAVLDLLREGRLKINVEQVIWYAYDLLTAAQQAFNRLAEGSGGAERAGRPNGLVASDLKTPDLKIAFGGPKPQKTNFEYAQYDSDKSELQHVFTQARAMLEDQPEQRIHIVIPDLQHRYSQVQELARQTFYPNASLTDVQQNHCVYRLSLGRAMHESPSIEVALCLISLLKSSLPLGDVRFLFRSVFLGVVQRHKDEFLGFESWLRGQRLRSTSLDRLADLLQEYREQQDEQKLNTEESVLHALFTKLAAFRADLAEKLDDQKRSSGYSALSFAEWAELFSQWLGLWQWQTNRAGAELSSVGHQLRKRWDNVLHEFAGLGAVQRNIGMSNAISSFQQLVRDTVFMPKAAASPLVISGVLEALGRETDVCFLTGMTDDFPAANKGDAFIPNHHLLPTGYPDASPQTSVDQARKVMQSLLASSAEAHISYARASASNQEEHKQPSPLFAEQLNNATLVAAQHDSDASSNQQTAELEAYVDTQGPAWRSPSAARGGASIFKNQSQCAFKAFVTHQLRFEVEQEPEFGLDHLDRGNLTHRMLELLWQQVPDQAFLNELGDADQAALLSDTFDQLLRQSASELNDDKLRLFAFEKPRVIELASEWLALERRRPTNFSVVEIESKYRGEWGGIPFDYVLDRVDVTESGQSVIVDYKTGTVTKTDWQGDRPAEPQLPLYVLVLDQLKVKKVSGIAYGQVRRGDCKYVELSEEGIFSANNKRAAETQVLWEQSRESWPDIFTRLAKDFLAGEATVNPVDKKACQYCELSAVCRVQELRERSNSLVDSTADDGSSGAGTNYSAGGEYDY